MSAHLAEPSPQCDRVNATHYLRAQLHRGGMPIGAARHGERNVALAAEGLSSLEALPWLATSSPGPTTQRAGRRPAARDRMELMLHVGLAAALTLLGGGAWYATGDTAAQPAPAVQGSLAPDDRELAALAEAERIAATDTPAATGQSPTEAAALAEAQQSPIAGAARLGREAAADRIKPVAAAQGSARDLPRVTRPAPSPAAGPDVATTSVSVVAPPPPPVADSPVTSTTLRQYRAAMDECNDAIRTIIRLGDRQRPGRDAAPAELASYRLRQQNAEAAKTYRAYLDTLARSVRGTNSETLTRQSLERARQTRSYLGTMLADSKASLR